MNERDATRKRDGCRKRVSHVRGTSRLPDSAPLASSTMDLINGNLDDTSCSHSQPIKRAPVVYGKRSNHHPVDEQERSFESRVVPSQTRASSPPLSIHASGNERSRSPDAADPFQFGFRHRLKELDEQFDDHDAQSSKPGPSQVKDLQCVSMGTAVLSSDACCPSGDLLRASLSPYPTSLRATSAQGNSPQFPLVRRRTRRAPIPSDSEAEEPSKSSSVSPVRHAITTPHSRSSPTPPTSGEIPMVSRKAKGKAPARDVLPLLFDGEPPSAVELPAKSKKGKRSEPSARSKTKV